MSIGIVGIGHYVPENIVTNHDIVQMGLDTSDEWIRERTGIGQRRVADPSMSTSDMGVKAAQEALKDAHVSPEDIDLVIVATSTPDFPQFPSTACLIQQRLGIRNVGAFDLSAACSGFNYALQTAQAFVASGQAKYVLLVAADCLSKVVNWKDRGTCILFGDGAGAAVIGPVGQGTGIVAGRLNADGTHEDILKVPAGGTRRPADAAAIEAGLNCIHMNGKAVFKVAVGCVVKTIQSVLKEAGLNADDIDYFVPHQANIRIIEFVAEKLKLRSEQVVANIDRYGNTSAASVPIALSEAAQSGRFKKGDLIVTIGFGAGFTWATTLIRWSKGEDE